MIKFFFDRSWLWVIGLIKEKCEKKKEWSIEKNWEWMLFFFELGGLVFLSLIYKEFKIGNFGRGKNLNKVKLIVKSIEGNYLSVFIWFMGLLIV